MSSGLPPRKKNWKPGTWQIGLFIRTPDNSQVESVWDLAPERVRELALKLLLERFPDIKTLASEPRPMPLLLDLGEDEEAEKTTPNPLTNSLRVNDDREP